MAKKTPPLVIPVVVDTSGVDGNLQNLNQRLRRSGRGGGGSGGIGGTGAGGFGTGGNNSLMASAVVGAAAGRAVRGRLEPSEMKPGWEKKLAEATHQQRQRYAWRSPGGMIYERMANFAQNRAKEYAEDNARLKEARHANRNTMNEADYVASRAATGRNQIQYDAWHKRQQQWRLASTTATTRFAAASRAAGGLATNPLVAGPIALGAAGMAYNAALMGNDFEGFKGSTNYGRMRAAQLAQFQAQRGKGGIVENFLLGGEQGYFGGTAGGGQLRDIGNYASYVANATARGAGRMLARPITGTAENAVRLVSWSIGAVADIGNYLNYSLGGGATSADARYRDKVQAYIGLN